MSHHPRGRDVLYTRGRVGMSPKDVVNSSQHLRDRGVKYFGPKADPHKAGLAYLNEIEREMRVLEPESLDELERILGPLLDSDGPDARELSLSAEERGVLTAILRGLLGRGSIRVEPHLDQVVMSVLKKLEER